QLVHKRKDGTLFPVEISTRLIEFDGRPVFQSFVRDITDRKRAEEQKQLSYDIANASTLFHDSIYEFSRYVHSRIKNHIDAVNFHLTLYDRENEMLKSVYVHDTFNTKVKTYERKFKNGLSEYVISNGKPLLLKISQLKQFIRKEGFTPKGELAQAWMIVPLNTEKRTIGVLTIESITDENAYSTEDIKLLEFISTQIASAVEKQQAIQEITKAHTAIENSMNGVISIDFEGNIVFSNPAAVKMWGFENANEALEARPHMLDYYDKAIHSKVNEILETIKTEGKYFDPEGLECMRKDGTGFIAQISASLVKNKKGDSVGITASFIDITEQKEIEKKYQTLIKTMNEGLIFSDENGILKYFNERFCDLVGYDRSELEGQNSFKLLLDRKDAETMRARVKDREKGVSEKYEIRIKRKKGNWIWCSVSASPVADDKGKFVGVMSTLSDITPLKNAEDQIESLAKSPSENPSPVLRVDKNYNIIYANTAGDMVLKELGLSGKRKITGFLRKSIMRCLKTNETINIDKLVGELHYLFTVTYVSGGPKWFQDIIGKENDYISIVGLDITERVNAEEALAKTEKQYKMLVENMNDGIIRVDNQEIIQYVNQQFCKLSGYTQDELIGNNASELLVDGDIELFKMRRRATRREKGKFENYEFPLKTKAGRKKWVGARGAPIYDDEGKVTGSIGANWDITERKIAERALRATNRELNTFMYKASHDLKGPLSSMFGLINLTREETNDPLVHRYLDLILSSVGKLDNILDDLIQITIIKQGKVQQEPVRISELIKDVLAAFSSLKDFNEVKITVNNKLNSPFACDSRLLKTILRNLLENAIKYRNASIKNSFANIEIHKKGEKILIEIADNGIGIPTKYHGDIFDMFFRANETSKGSGLGLYIVKNAVEKLGGTIKIKSNPNAGTTFTIYLPLDQQLNHEN
ncbi:MAG TPA: PAS domain S-box protein, partial [Flavobacteriales bacterium]|nr:PAS domain S-box protein [Flavobacteriales bacterium]